MRGGVSRASLRPAVAAGLLAALAIAAGCRGRAEEAAPEPVLVTDSADVLSERERLRIESYLEFIEAERGVDYRVVVMNQPKADLAREGVTRYEDLGIGARTGGRGLLLLVNMAAGEARVEVGYDLEHRVRDVEASSMIRDLLAPYFASGEVGIGIEASVERLVEVLEPSRQEAPAGRPLGRSGGAGATAALFEGIDRLTPETRARLQTILVPQATPGECVRLEMALLHKGIYFRDAPMYDDAWRRANRPDLPARRLKAIAAEWDGPFKIASSGDHAIAYFEGDRAVRWGPNFLRRTDAGWIVDGSAVARYIVYDYSNRWVAVDGDYPYLALIQGVYDMQASALHDRGPAWMMRPPGGS
jgi:uncharacterized membrane protein YgcG